MIVQKQPSYILIEGIDGAGKTTVCNGLTEILQKRNNNVVRMREPGGTPVAEHIRSIVLGMDYLKLTEQEEITPLAEMFMMLAARSQSMALVQRVISNPNTFIVADRGFPSTYAYQAIDDATKKLYEDTWQVLAPENRLSVLLTCSYDTSCERRKQRYGFGDRIEQRITEESFETMRNRYLEVPGGYDLVIDTDDMAVSDVIREILGHIFP